MQKELHHILEKFPDHRAKIISLFSSSEDFKSLCDDYYQCKHVMKQLSGDSLEDFWEEEYRQLCTVLEEEVLWFLARDEVR